MLIPTITLQPGDSGDNVRELQRRLVAVGQLDEGNVNGSYDGMTTNAVRDFQGIHGLNADGIAGPKTIRKLNAAVAGTLTDEGSSDKREEEQEQDKNAEHFAIAEQAEAEKALDPEALGIEAEAAPAPPAAPTREDIAPSEKAAGPESTEALFMDDPALETNMMGKEDPPTPKAPEPEVNKQPIQEAAAQQQENAAGLTAAPPPRAETIRFDDPRLDAIDRALPEPVKVEVKQVGVVMLENGTQQSAVPPEMDIGGPSQTPQVQQQKTTELGA